MNHIIITREALLATPRESRLPQHRFAAHLFEIGGDRLVWFDDDDAEAFLWDERLFTAEVRMRRGRRNRCHGNSAKLWGKDTDRRQIGTGYALSDDGTWRRHSWVLQGKRLYETTVPRERYFGVVLTPKDSLCFFLSTFVAEQYPDLRTIPAGFFDPYPGVLALIKEAQREARKGGEVQMQEAAPALTRS